MGVLDLLLELKYVVIAVATVLLYYLYQILTASNDSGKNNGKRKYPPGPRGLPIVGYWPFLGDYPQELIAKLGEKYGKIFMLPVGQMNVVILNDYEAIKEAFLKYGNAFTARPSIFYNANAIFPAAGLFLSTDESFKDQRRFMVNVLKDFSKVSFGESIFKECEIVMNHIAAHKGAPFEPMPYSAGVMANIMLRFLFSDHFNYNTPELKRMLQLSQKCDEIVGMMAAIDFMPWLKYFPDRLTGVHYVKGAQHEMQAIFKNKIADHQETFNEKRIRDFTDAFIDKMKSEKRTGKESIYNEECMLSNAIILFVAGAGAAAITTSMLLNIITIQPEIQEKVIDEIDRIIGDRAPQYTDRFNMPYTEATLFEILRYGDVTPLGVYRLCTEPVKVLGYDIPKDAVVYPHVGKMNNDVNLWKNPTDFDPQHFLDANGKTYRPDYWMPFGLGKKNCPGSNFANMMMFMVFTSLMQRFRFFSPPGTANKMEPIPGTFRYMKPFHVCAKERTV